MLTELLEGQGEGAFSWTCENDSQNTADLAHPGSYSFSNWKHTESGVGVEAVDLENTLLSLLSSLGNHLALQVSFLHLPRASDWTLTCRKTPLVQSHAWLEKRR